MEAIGQAKQTEVAMKEDFRLVFVRSLSKLPLFIRVRPLENGLVIDEAIAGVRELAFTTTTLDCLWRANTAATTLENQFAAKLASASEELCLHSFICKLLIVNAL